MSDRSVIIRKFENQIASYSDYLSETSDKIMYREYITPKKGKNSGKILGHIKKAPKDI